MIRFVINDFATAAFLAEWKYKELERLALASDQKGLIDSDQRESFLATLRTIQTACEPLGLKRCLATIGHLTISLKYKDDSVRYNRLSALFHVLWCELEKEVGENTFAFIPAPKVQFFENDKLFGDVVTGHFKTSQRGALQNQPL